MADLVTLTIDGQSVAVPKGTLVWQAARQAGIDIPIYCYHPKMPPVGACRICLVQIEKMPPKPQASCTTQVAEGMVVHTQSEMATKARSSVMEFLLINHPLDCPICDKGGECDLQDFTVAFGRGSGRFHEEKRHLGKAIPLGDNIALDRERCIMCQRCVRFSNEIAMEDGLLIAERGVKAEIDTFPGRPYNSIFSGNTVEMCPVGALTARTYRFRARPWELKHSPAICGHCSVGCNLTVDIRHGREVVRFRSRVNDAVDDGFLCDRGRYGYGIVHSAERITTPLVRKNGQLQPASWPEAFDSIIAGLQQTIKTAGPSAVGGINSTHSTNEEIYLFQKFLNSVIGSNNVDFRHGTTLNLGSDSLTGTIAGLEEANVIVLVAADPSTRQPVIDLRIKKAIRKGAKVLVIGPTPTGLDRLAAQVIRTTPDQLPAVLSVITNRIGNASTVTNEPQATNTDASTPGLAPQSTTIKPTGVPQDDPLATGQRETDPHNKAQAIASEAAQQQNTDPQPDSAAVSGPADRDNRAEIDAAVTLLNAAKRVNILFDDDATLIPGGASLMNDVVALARATNSFGVEGAGLMLLVPDNNSMGARELSQAPGATYAQMLNGAVKALLVMGSNPVAHSANADALRGLDLLVVMDTFLSETAQLAHVILPSATFVEKEGTFTSTERRVQYTVPAVDPQKGAVPDWAILHELARRMGKPFATSTPAEVFAEIAAQSPFFAGKTYAELAAQGSTADGPDTSGQTPSLLPLWQGGPNGLSRIPLISRAAGGK